MISSTATGGSQGQDPARPQLQVEVAVNESIQVQPTDASQGPVLQQEFSPPELHSAASLPSQQPSSGTDATSSMEADETPRPSVLAASAEEYLELTKPPTNSSSSSSSEDVATRHDTPRQRPDNSERQS